MRTLRMWLLAAMLCAGAAGLSVPAIASAQDHGAHGAEGAHGAPTEHGEDHGDAHGAGHDAHGGEHHAEINTFELGGSVVNFALLLLVLFLLMRKSLPEFLRNRRASVVEGMEEAKRVKEEAETKYKEYSARIDNLDAELDRLREEMRRAGMDERDRIVADASKRAEKMRDEARFLIEQQMKQLREDLTREAIEAAVAAAESMLVQSTNAQDQERLAKDYLGTIRTSLAEKVQEKRL
ncbi:ATP synthase F0 subunit B [Sandaracinus amylolyticus]|uniref:ATP synthase subunit b n=1 Tax=Sandaracinus amylolyticus TaxID=927083 RepID=A0A0F6W217_9BACT|nr:ATP synthase F0 subunit B [Sandaracinus amylolyticus]AKF05462.1 ATP synthase F0 sector subunit b [Sandaracinus amylolyticus]